MPVEIDNERILLVEDEEDLRTGLRFALEQDGYAVDTAVTVAEADAAVEERPYDLLILDVSLPDGNGFDLCERIRNGGYTGSRGDPVQVIFLTAKDDELDIIRGLEIGGDDYITKPFRVRELLSRVKARLRRGGTAAPVPTQLQQSRQSVTSGSVSGESPDESSQVRLDENLLRIERDGESIPLTSGEYRLLRCLMDNPGQTLTRDRLIDRLLGIQDAVVDDNTLSVYIRRIREKVEVEPSRPRLIQTVRGIGYRYVEDDESRDRRPES
jgi:two-component system, OmpR family, response regulator RegX3